MDKSRVLTVVFFYWKDPRNPWLSEYDYCVDDVNRVRRMVDRHLSIPHEFVCVIDKESSAEGMDKDIRTVLVDKHLVVSGKRFQKLMVFRPDAEEIFGKRILLMDLDVVITRSFDHLVQREDEIILWKNPSHRNNTPYNTSMVLLDAGCRPEVYTEFEVRHALSTIQRRRLSGTDQAWVSHMLGNEPTWSILDGVCSFKKDYLKGNSWGLNNDHSCIVFFNGRISPVSTVVKNQFTWLYNIYIGAAWA